ncbi:MAG: hypothetical protein RIR14_2245, partial [Pseudomonadota bacterium]
KGQGAQVLADVADMRRRLSEAKPGQGGWDAKFGPGRLMDIELLAQTLALQAAIPARQLERQISLGAKRPNMSQADQAALLDTYRLCWRLHCASRLLTERTVSPQDLGEGGRAFVLRECAVTGPEALTEQLIKAAALAERVIVAHLRG